MRIVTSWPLYGDRMIPACNTHALAVGEHGARCVGVGHAR
jgi:hypothetical protein